MAGSKLEYRVIKNRDKLRVDAGEELTLYIDNEGVKVRDNKLGDEWDPMQG